ncbi:uracil-DNA glycosylase [Candidatus Nanohalobium constans]|uniref:Type-4 uracil-DNA glycosylase n=1 Tax=Candidatus Nanohalobium constans TaxID=2565781 RepID=A0A5Q0UG50_9ARCH|nr:uracil-DNA glycosylase [Candidatus Nanohalobium constans]QGA80577.1 uracil-DNA glycosylase [Candidatus Nanohalobium constans]
MTFKEKYGDFFETLHPDYWEEERFVPAVGPEDAEVMLVGEAPGANEVEEGEPFVGRAGEKMNDVLRDIGADRDELYITNLVKIRPPDNRDPKKEEIEAWAPLLEEEIEAVDPDIILTLGNFASKEMLDTKKGISQIHGRIFSREGRKIMPVYHPAATLYDRSKTPDLEKDLRKALGKEDTGQQKLSDL